MEEVITNMYAHLHVFQYLTVDIMEQHNHVQTKNIHLATIQEGLDEIKIWIIENIDALVELPLPSEVEIIMDYTSLDWCQQVG
jgi:hypothetical protein